MDFCCCWSSCCWWSPFHGNCLSAENYQPATEWPRLFSSFLFFYLVLLLLRTGFAFIQFISIAAALISPVFVSSFVPSWAKLRALSWVGLSQVVFFNISLVFGHNCHCTNSIKWWPLACFCNWSARANGRGSSKRRGSSTVKLHYGERLAILAK